MQARGPPSARKKPSMRAEKPVPSRADQRHSSGRQLPLPHVPERTMTTRKRRRPCGSAETVPFGSCEVPEFPRLSRAQVDTLLPIVRGHEVYDLGAGALQFTRALAPHAQRVVAVEQALPEGLVDALQLPNNVEVREMTFAAMLAERRPGIDVAFVSWPDSVTTWPATARCTLVQLLHEANVVVYIGCNMDGWACGSQALFKELMSRELLAYEPSPAHHNMVIVGDPPAEGRQPTAEELAGSLNDGRMRPLSYSQAHALASMTPKARAAEIQSLRLPSR